jgi:colanic acid/amylovoran biosynthesis protein
MLGSVLSSGEVTRVFVRERLSLAFLQGLLPERTMKEKVELCGDVAFCLETRPDASSLPAGPDLPAPIIAVTVRRWDFPEVRETAEKSRLQDAYLDALATACATVGRRHGGSVLVFPQSRGPGEFEDDRPVSRGFAQRLAAKAPDLPVQYVPLPDTASPFDIIRLLTQAHLVVATRFHSAILGFLAGVPAVSIAYQPKSRGIMEEMGFDELTIDISAVDANRLIEMMSRVLDDHASMAADIRDRVMGLRRQIRETTLRAVRHAVT